MQLSQMKNRATFVKVKVLAPVGRVRVVIKKKAQSGRTNVAAIINGAVIHMTLLCFIVRTPTHVSHISKMFCCFVTSCYYGVTEFCLIIYRHT